MPNVRFKCVFMWIFIQFAGFGYGTTVYEPSFLSTWITAKAQDDHKVEFYVPFTDVENATETHLPVKVIVEVKVEDGDDYYIFNAFGSSPRDDDATEKYGGVIYFYNASGVLIFLPEKFENDPLDIKKDDGKTVYLGTVDRWYHPLSNREQSIKREYTDAFVRVKMWRRNDMPPDFDSGFQYNLNTLTTMSTATTDQPMETITYLEIPFTNMTSAPDMVVVQAKPPGRFDELRGLVSEGNGMPACLRCGSDAGGLAFAYNTTHVRVWVKLNHPITSAADGWGDRHYQDKQRLVSHEAAVRVLAWTFDNAPNRCRWTWNERTTINDASQDTPRMIFPGTKNPTEFLVLVTISPLNGPNHGFQFYGAGSVVTSGDYNPDKPSRYSGLIFGYNQYGVFVWRVRPTTTSYTFDIDEPWGGGKEQHQTNDVEIGIYVFGLMSRNSCNTTDLAVMNGYLNPSLLQPCENEAVVCNFGYHIENETHTVARCNLLALWNSNVPQCIETLCPDEIDPPNGIVLEKNLSVNGVIQYACNERFNISAGNLNRTCFPNGTWSGILPTCSEIRCPSLLDPINGAVNISGTLIDGVATFSCNPGFTLTDGSLTRTCAPNGSWTGTSAECSEIFCPWIAVQDNVIVGYHRDAAHNISVNTTAFFACQPGFSLSSYETITCLITGDWSADSPVCNEIFCPPVNASANSEMVISNHSVNSTLTYSCIDGFEHTFGNLHRTCLLDGTWSGDPPNCSEIFCPGLYHPLNGKAVAEQTSINSQAIYSCDTGFNHTGGDLTRTCQLNGTWSGEPAICSEIFCTDIQTFENGDVTYSVVISSSSGVPINSTASFSCDAGFRLSLDLNITCLVTGSWSEAPPVCSEILCPNVTDPGNGRVESIDNKVNGSLLYSCNTDFEVTSGNLSRVCTLNGTWSGGPPICSDITCLALPFPDNGRIDVSTQDPTLNTLYYPMGSQSSYAIGTQASYACNPGFNPSRSDLTRTCLNNGTWDGNSVTCDEIFCPPLTISASTIMNLSTGVSKTNSMDISVNTSATFSCKPGFRLNDSSSLLCQIDGTWNGTLPNCSEIYCPDLETPPNSTLTSIDKSVNGTAQFVCNKGYQQTNGSLQQKCLATGKWSGIELVCKAIGDCLCPCDFVTVPKYTNVSDVRLIQKIEKMQKELVVLKNQTSAALRKKICIKDFRPSTNASGAVWVVFLIVLAGLIIIPDMLKAIRYILLNFFQNGHSYHRRFHKS
ncbi:sushi, von Willebrand factor type A, EGF and pentraxin domain-containing protein 1 isoform X1 [Magallana gigas]|uniref:sushi, von Willebrand factor type A, EGF and pentraxin domain-containing protein 1 isoform X1 n=1 Tax=Magallana gigas TaxID=29159 RepID=UPI00333FA47B